MHKLNDNVYMQTATWLTSRELADKAGPWNESYSVDDDGEYWRLYDFVTDGRTLDRPATKDEARLAARSFGEFNKALADLPGGPLNETIPHFHDTESRFDALMNAIARDELNFRFQRSSPMTAMGAAPSLSSSGRNVRPMMGSMLRSGKNSADTLSAERRSGSPTPRRLKFSQR